MNSCLGIVHSLPDEMEGCTSMPIAKQFHLSVDFPTEVCSYSIFYIQISRFWVDLSEIGAKTLSSQSQISELLFKRFSLQSSE